VRFAELGIDIDVLPTRSTMVVGLVVSGAARAPEIVHARGKTFAMKNARIEIAY